MEIAALVLSIVALGVSVIAAGGALAALLIWHWER